MRYLLTLTLLSLLLLAPTVQAATPSSFKTACSHVNAAQIDPMVEPGVEPSDHLHEFFGHTGVTKNSTGKTLQFSGAAIHTSCRIAPDTASYWTPALYANGVRAEPGFLVAYYTRIIGLQTSTGAPIDTALVPYTGMNLITGNKLATSPQPLSVVKYQCNNINFGGGAQAYPPECSEPGAGGLAIQVTFPGCWTNKLRPAGVNVDDVQHKTSVSGVKKCPAGYNYQIPELRLGVHYPNVVTRDCRASGTGPCVTYSLATNPLLGASIHQFHANFMNGWANDNPVDPANGFGLNSLTARCNNPGTPEGCGDIGTVPPGDAFEG